MKLHSYGKCEPYKIPKDYTLNDGLALEGLMCDLPDGISVWGDVIACSSTIANLPDNLTVNGDLYMSDTQLRLLPNGLWVGGSLYILNTNVSHLPPDLHVGGWVYANDGQLIASNSVQVDWVTRGAYMLQQFKSPTVNAIRLHEMLWEL